MNPTSPGEDVFIRKIKEIVDSNLPDENFGGVELARQAGLSRTNLNRKLKAKTKMPVSRFIREIRLKKAMEILQQEDCTVSEVAFRVGFGSPAHFNHCFHSHYGFTPGESRKRALLKDTDNVDPPETKIPGDSSGKGISNAEPVKKQIQIKRKVIIPLSMIVIFCSFVSVLFWCRPRNPNLLSINREKSIVVLPFTNDSRDTVNLFFVNGIAEAITDKLANIRDLKVTSRFSSEKYRNNTQKSARQIARELKVNYIVEGSGQKIGDEVLISVQLIDARSDKHILSQQFTRRYEDVFSLYSEIALAVAGKIRALITPEEREFIEDPSTGNIAALRLFIRADELNSLKDVDQSLRTEYISEAEKKFRQAIQLDSAYSDAWVKWGSLYLSRGKPDSSLVLADRALQYDPENAKAWFLKGQAYILIRNGDAMKESLKKAVKLDPGDPWAVHWLGAYHYCRGDFSKALEALLRTRSMLGTLQPGSSNAHLTRIELNTLRLARFLFGMGFYEEGKKFLKEWLELSNDDVWGYNYNLMWAEIIQSRFEEVYQTGLNTPEKELCFFYMGINMILLKKYTEAVVYFQKQVEKARRNGNEKKVDTQFMLAYALMKSGQKEEAERWFTSAEKNVRTMLSDHPESARPEHVYAINDRYARFTWFILASIYAVRGERQKALEYLRLLRENYPASDLQVVFYLKYWPMLDNIRNEPEFRDYLKEAEMHYLEERTKVEELLRAEGIIR